MPNTLVHKFVSAIPDDSNNSLVRPSNWNDEHVFAGGADWNVIRKRASNSDGVDWLDLSAHLGAVNVLEYGAVGNGSTDDTASISNAQTAAITVNRPLLFPGGKIYAMASNFTFTVPVILIDSRLKPSLGVTLSFTDTIYGNVYQIFDADGTSTGLISITKPSSIVRPEWWGADNTGVAVNAELFFERAMTALLTNGGTIQCAGPYAVYRFGADVNVTCPDNLTIDGQYCTFTSTASRQFRIDGDAGVDGDRSDAVDNFVYRNIRHGTANDANNKFSGPKVSWANNTLIENLVIKGHQNGIDYQFVDAGTVRNIDMAGSGSGQIGILHLISNYCRYEDIYIHDSSCVYGFQIKGGISNVVKNVTGNAIATFSGYTAVDTFIRNRGDAPYGASGTGGTYPFSTGSWATPDDRRRSQGSVFENISLYNSPNVVFAEDEESVDSFWRNVRGVDIAKGFECVKEGTDKNKVLDGFYFESVGTTAGLTSTGNGISVGGTVGSLLEGITIRNGIINGCEAEGILSDYLQRSLFDNITIYNAGQGLAGTTRQRGIEIANSTRPTISRCVTVDNQGSPTMDIGIYVDPTCTWPTLTDNYASGCITEQIRSWVLGQYQNNKPGEATASTTDASNIEDRLRFAIASGDVVEVEVIAVAKEGTTNRATYGVRGLVYADGSGNVTLQGATQDIFTAIESDATWGGISFVSFGASNTFRVRIVGKAATNITWVLYAFCRRVS